MFHHAIIGNIGVPEILIILIIGLLLFGSRLPEVGRSLGKGLMEFKKGLRGVQDEVRGIEREADHLIDEELHKRKTLSSSPEPARTTVESAPPSPSEQKVATDQQSSDT